MPGQKSQGRLVERGPAASAPAARAPDHAQHRQSSRQHRPACRCWDGRGIGRGAGRRVHRAGDAASPIRVEIVRKPEGQVGFTVHARRWVVERFFAWINRNRRLAKDLEATIASAEAFL